MRRLTYEIWELDNLYLFVFNMVGPVYSRTYGLCDDLHDDVMALERGDDPMEWDGDEFLDYDMITESATLIAMDGELFLQDVGRNGWHHFCDCQPIEFEITGHVELFDSPDALDDWWEDTCNDRLYQGPISHLTVGGLKCDETCIDRLVRNLLK